MLVSAFLLMLFGIGIVWLVTKIREEVYQIGLGLIGLIAIIWGFAIAPFPFQLLVEGLLFLLYKIYTSRLRQRSVKRLNDGASVGCW